MKVIYTNVSSTVDRYNMTQSADIKKLSDFKGMEMKVAGICHYTDTNAKGEENEILSLQDETGVYATNSATFIEAFFKMKSMFDEAGEDLPAIKVSSGISKSGREFITCVLA